MVGTLAAFTIGFLLGAFLIGRTERSARGTPAWTARRLRLRAVGWSFPPLMASERDELLSLAARVEEVARLEQEGKGPR